MLGEWGGYAWGWSVGLAAWAQENGEWDLESLSALPVVSDLEISPEQLEALMDERERILEQAEAFA